MHKFVNSKWTSEGETGVLQVKSTMARSYKQSDTIIFFLGFRLFVVDKVKQ